MTNLDETCIDEFLGDSRQSRQSQSKIPPTGAEVKVLLDYLQSKGLDPIIVGSLAVYLHLRKKSARRDIKLVDDFEIAFEVSPTASLPYTKDLDLFISKTLPPLLSGWRLDKGSVGVTSWLSPSGGYVDFLVAGHQFPDNSRNPKKIGKDPDALKIGFPLADLPSLFAFKLNSFRTKDLIDLLSLIKVVGLPKKLPPLNQTQKENLALLEIAAKNF